MAETLEMSQARVRQMSIIGEKHVLQAGHCPHSFEADVSHLSVVERQPFKARESSELGDIGVIEFSNHPNPDNVVKNPHPLVADRMPQPSWSCLQSINQTSIALDNLN